MTSNNFPNIPVTSSRILSVVCRKISQRDIDRYASISGDDNPLHINVDYASKTKFGSTIAHGMLVLQLVEDMMLKNFGEIWLDEGELEVRFKQPAFPGDVLVSEGKIKNICARRGSRRILCEVKVTNTEEVTVLAGTARLKIRKE